MHPDALSQEDILSLHTAAFSCLRRLFFRSTLRRPSSNSKTTSLNSSAKSCRTRGFLQKFGLSTTKNSVSIAKISLTNAFVRRNPTENFRNDENDRNIQKNRRNSLRHNDSKFN